MHKMMVFPLEIRLKHFPQLKYYAEGITESSYKKKELKIETCMVLNYGNRSTQQCLKSKDARRNNNKA